jgi:hypothetical protein
MPIGASAGTLDIENATLRSNAIAVLTNLVAGNDQVRQSGPPTLEVYGDPSHGGNEARLELVSNMTDTVSNSFTRLTSNAGVFSIETGTSGTSDNGTITFGGFQNERLRITSDGKVGVGTNNPQYRLDVGNGGGDVMLRVMNQTASSGKLIFGRTGNTEIRSHAIETYNSSGADNNYMKFLVHDGTGTAPYETRTEVMTLRGDGNVGIGTVSPIGNLSVVRDTVVGGGTTYQRGMFYKDGKLQIAPPDLYNGYPLDGDFLTTSRYLADGTTDYTAAAFGVAYDVASGSQSALYFKTAVSASSLTEKMRITGGGNVGIGTNNPQGKLHVYPGSDGAFMVGSLSTTEATAPMCIRDAANQQIHFYYSTNKVGSITSTPSATAYNTTSDYRLKENLVELTSALDRVNEISVYRFNFIAEPNKTVDGFLAHELQSIIPEAVTGVKDEMIEFGVVTRTNDGTIIHKDVKEPKILDEGTEWSATSSRPIYQGVDQSKIVPLLTRSVQELSIKNDTLEIQLASVLARLDALENA